MPRRPLPAVLPVALLFCGAVLSLASARAGEPVADHALGAAAWPGLPAEERVLVEAVAREVWAETGEARRHYDGLPEARKAALRGTAMRRLGLEPRDIARGWV